MQGLSQIILDWWSKQETNAAHQKVGEQKAINAGTKKAEADERKGHDAGRASERDSDAGKLHDDDGFRRKD